MEINNLTFLDKIMFQDDSAFVNNIGPCNKVTHGRFVNFLEYALFFLVIIEFNTAYLEYEPLPKYLFYGTSFVLTILLFRNKTFKIDGILVLYFIGSLLPILNVYPGMENKYIKLYWVIAPLFILYFSSLRRISFERIISILIKYSNIVTILALISLIYWVLGSNLEIIQPTLFVPNTWAGDGVRLIPTYHFIYFETQDSSFMGYETVRNSGIFNEGPIYNMILCVALAMELFLRPRKSLWRIIILAFTIVTTFTTTGFLFLTFAGAWIVFKFFSQKGRILLLAILPLLAIGVMNFSAVVIEDKESSSGEGSIKSRTTDILTCSKLHQRHYGD